MRRKTILTYCCCHYSFVGGFGSVVRPRASSRNRRAPYIASPWFLRRRRRRWALHAYTRLSTAPVGESAARIPHHGDTSLSRIIIATVVAPRGAYRGVCLRECISRSRVIKYRSESPSRDIHPRHARAHPEPGEIATTRHGTRNDRAVDLCDFSAMRNRRADASTDWPGTETDGFSSSQNEFAAFRWCVLKKVSEGLKLLSLERIRRHARDEAIRRTNSELNFAFGDVIFSRI